MQKSNNILDIMTIQYPKLSSAQKRIADYILKNPHEACFLSLKQMSEKVSATEKTIINFTKKIGIPSYIQFKKELQAYISDRISPDEKMVQAVSSIKESNEEFVKGMCHSELSVIKKSIERLNLSELMIAVEIISKANSVIILSHNISSVVADFLAYRLASLGISSRLIDPNDKQGYNNLIYHIGKDDVLVVLSFPRYDNDLVCITEVIKERGNRVIAITDNLNSKVASSADVTFLCGTDTTIFYNSYSGAMVISNILVSTVARYAEERVVEHKRGVEIIKYALKDKREKII